MLGPHDFADVLLGHENINSAGRGSREKGRFGIALISEPGGQERATDHAVRAICAARRKRQNASEAKGSVGIPVRPKLRERVQPCRN
jgi:hypothetical protein